MRRIIHRKRNRHLTQESSYPTISLGNQFISSVPMDNPTFPKQLEQLLLEPVLIIDRQLETPGSFTGYYQVNQYKVFNQTGQQIGWLQELSGFAKSIFRNEMGENRPFKVQVTNMNGELLLEVKRSWTLVNSHVTISTPYKNPSGLIFNHEIGRSEQLSDPLRRNYRLYTVDKFRQSHSFGKITSGIGPQSFPLQNSIDEVIGAIDRGFSGVDSQAVSEWPKYYVRFSIVDDSTVRAKYKPCGHPMSLSQRAVLLGCAISIDLDHFTH